jgi:DNA-binding NtrC family response regulator
MAEILVIDDEEYVRKAIRRILEKEGHKITEAANGTEGKNHILLKHFDLIIIDIFMPGQGGIDMLLDLKNKCEGSILIIISGKPPMESSAFSTLIESFGVKKVLQKPYKKEELINTVNELLNENSKCK